MAKILFDQNTKLGEVSEWVVDVRPPAYKDVLGKRVLLSPANDEVTFVSPKPVNRKSKLKVIDGEKTEVTLKLIKVVGGTHITARIVESRSLRGR